jgi:hypothetical protein
LQKERVPINIEVGHNKKERNSPMTDEAVHISITIKVEERVEEIQRKIPIAELEEGVQAMTQGLGQQVLNGVIGVLDDRIAAHAPAGWRNVGTEERCMISSLGAMRYKRRVYLDGDDKRHKPVDELLGIERYWRMSMRVQEMGSYLASIGTYRLAASQLSWQIKTNISHSAIQRMAWGIGNRIADGEEAERRRVFEIGGELEGGKVKAPVLYGESDGVWVHLQREKHRSAEVRVGTLCTGRKQIGKDRYRLENKRCITAIDLNSEKWQEEILREAHLYYDLSKTQILITGGDGNQWVRQSFNLFGLQQEFILDRFHLSRAARRAFQDRNEARLIVKKLRTEGFAAVNHELLQKIELAQGRKKELLIEFYKYVRHNQDGLLDLEHRGYSHPAVLGGIEGNVDKMVVHRMKGRGCSWRLKGLRGMLALNRNRDLLKYHAYRYLPVQIPEKIHFRLPDVRVEYSEAVQKPMPIFHGPDQAKPWVRSLSRYIHGR